MFCWTVPREPKNTTITFAFDETSITVLGDVTSIEAEAGLIDKYNLTSLSPDEGTNDAPQAFDANLTLSGLTPGEEYTIELGSIIDACTGVASTTNTVNKQCTSEWLSVLRC